MKDVFYLLFHALTTLAKLIRPGDSHAIIAENFHLMMPMSHPFVERLIGSVRRELLDQAFFWTATDLENKLRDYQSYYNERRTHSGRGGAIPVELADRKVIAINQYRWGRHCRGLYQLPAAA